MIIAHIDTPWFQFPDGWGPELANDFPDIGTTDVTGSDWHEWDGNQVKGGNYPKATGHPKSGDPDYLTVEVKDVPQATLDLIDADQKYWVYYTEEILQGEVTPQAVPYKDKSAEPPAAEWGQLRSRLALRGVSQQWIDEHLGTQRERTRGQHDFNMRQGYVRGQI